MSARSKQKLYGVTTAETDNKQNEPISPQAPDLHWVARDSHSAPYAQCPADKLSFCGVLLAEGECHAQGLVMGLAVPRLTGGSDLAEQPSDDLRPEVEDAA